MTLSQSIAVFITQLDHSNIPSDVLEKAKTCLLNGYGIGLGCHNTPYAPVARRAALAMNGEWKHGGATLLGDGRRTSVAGAALANSALFHGRAQEDTCGAAHFGAILIPLLTAMIEADVYPLERLLPSLLAGYEAGGLLEQAYAGITTPAGFRASAVYGTVAAAAAAAKLMNLPVEQTAAALSNAASFAGGLLQSFADGTDEWRYQVGVAGQTGYTAAQLARAGSVSAPGAFEGDAGFIKAFTGQKCDAEALAARLGKDWAMHRVTFKPFPVCAFNQTPVTAGLVVREQLKGHALESIRRIIVRMNPYETGYAGMDSKGPFNSISGTLMSIPFCIANTLLYGIPDMKAMTAYDDARVNDLMTRIDLVSDENVKKLCCAIRVELPNDEVIDHQQLMEFADYAYDRAGVSELIRRVGAESDLPGSLYDGLEAFTLAPENHRIADVINCFSALPGSTAWSANNG
ncbi:MmgE/PrpD family protein 4 [Pollutimonas nitritireducens]|uniref:MmgE/PrpD family protein 4 n=1 Tax=Pollutimonas nitritireducens TaxID=2045209 RepID=A0A2N4UB96_9BURK|nr:MmgE/PrpD family protein [Pollutimonas nitritireducens]PLC52273.1 MmgE/PrpD family protein 4 [Pollutimonas nitritireducens]